jgi:hypothetical protein
MPRWMLILLTAMMAPCHAQVLASADRANLSNVAQFHMLATASIPKDVFVFCADANGRLAAPGENWNPIDVMFPNLASRRLIWVSRSNEYLVAHYEQGGFVHSMHIAIARARPDGSGYDLIWRADGPALRDYREFAGALKANVFHPERPFER